MRPDMGSLLFPGLGGNLRPAEIIARFLQHAAPARVAEWIDGTELTAFIEDLRLAWKVVSVLADEHALRPQSQLMAARARTLEHSVSAILESGERLAAEMLIRAVSIHPTVLTRRLLDGWAHREFTVRIVDRDDLREHSPPRTANPLGLLLREPAGGSLIWIADFDPMERSNDQFLERARMLVHEFEHHRHSVLNYFPRSPMTMPIDLLNRSEHERLVSEVLSFLEEARWDLVNGLVGSWDLYGCEGGVIEAVVAKVERIYFQSWGTPSPRVSPFSIWQSGGGT